MSRLESLSKTAACQRAPIASESKRALFGGLLKATVIGALSLMLFLAASLPSHSSNGLAVSVFLNIVLGTGIAVLVYVLIRYHHILAGLHESVRQVSEGLWCPVPTPAGRQFFLERLVTDYNCMILTLRSVFRSVDECQGRVVRERNKINAILQSLPGALFSVDDNLIIRTVNRQAEELFESDQSRLLGKGLFDLLQLGEGDLEILRDAFLYKRPLHNQEIRLEMEGRYRWISLNMSFLSEEEEDMGAVLTLQDITEYKQLQESVHNREKLVALGQLAGGVAHELNTPLGNVLGYSQLLREMCGNRGGDEKIVRYTGIISDEAKRCSRIVQDLLNYVRHENCRDEVCDLNAVVREVIETFTTCQFRRNGIEAILILDSSNPIVETEVGQFDIVLTNLIVNAVYALKSVSYPKIRVETRVEHPEYASIFIEDNGPGIPAEIRNRIFDPFFTTKDVDDGSGLGLSISQALLAKRGGIIKHDPEYLNGARFIIKLRIARS